MAMKDIVIKITGRQFVGDQEKEDQIEFVTDGKIYERGGARYLVYRESELSGFPGCMTTLKLKENAVKLRRIGKQVSYHSEIEFRPGRRLSTTYTTPYGDLDLEVVTDRIRNRLGEDGLGDVSIDYQIAIGGVAEGRNQLRIEVSDQNAPVRIPDVPEESSHEE